MCIRRNRSLSPFVVLALAVAASVTGLAGCTGGGEDMESAFKQPLEESVAQADDIDRRYSDEELGIDALISEAISDIHPWVRRGSAEERLQAVDANLAELTELRGHERERRLFEHLIDAQVTFARSELAGELHIADGILALAFHAALDECAREAGISDGAGAFVALDYGTTASDDPSGLGLGRQELIELRHECALHASRYPTLSDSERERVIALTVDALRHHVDAWMQANPDRIVPIEYHPGVNQPLADELAERCRRAPEPERCALERGVVLAPG